MATRTRAARALMHSFSFSPIHVRNCCRVSHVPGIFMTLPWAAGFSLSAWCSAGNEGMNLGKFPQRKPPGMVCRGHSISHSSRKETTKNSGHSISHSLHRSHQRVKQPHGEPQPPPFHENRKSEESTSIRIASKASWVRRSSASHVHPHICFRVSFDFDCVVLFWRSHLRLLFGFKGPN